MWTVRRLRLKTYCCSQHSKLISCHSTSSKQESERWETTLNMFIPTRKVAKGEMSANQYHNLMVEGGLIRQSSSGIFHILPMGQRALDKLSCLVHAAMHGIRARKMSMPVLVPAELWKKTGRWDSAGHELFRLKNYCLGPTHEESVTDLVGRSLSSYRQLPIRLYQLDRKFRDEKRAQYGLLRCREFWMKDLYTFDVTPEESLNTYNEVCKAYEHLLLEKLKLPVLKVQAATGNIGGSLSHEYHLPSSIGMDTLLTCQTCGAGISKELLDEREVNSGSSEPTKLPNCPEEEGKHCQLSTCKGIEIAHTFLLGTKYSAAFDLSFTDSKDVNRLLEMGCYGVGVSRLMAASLRVNCEKDGWERLVWPLPIAPFHVCVLPLVHDVLDPLIGVCEELCSSLEEVCPGDVILENRTHVSLSVRRRHTEVAGYPVIIMVGKKTPHGSYELTMESDSEWKTSIVNKETLLDVIKTSYSAANVH